MPYQQLKYHVTHDDTLRISTYRRWMLAYCKDLSHQKLRMVTQEVRVRVCVREREREREKERERESECVCVRVCVCVGVGVPSEVVRCAWNWCERVCGIGQKSRAPGHTHALGPGGFRVGVRV